jgi:putative glycosyltransferase (TIGR04372 family)
MTGPIIRYFRLVIIKKISVLYVRVLIKLVSFVIATRQPEAGICLFLFKLMPANQMTIAQKKYVLTVLTKVLGNTKSNVAIGLHKSIIRDLGKKKEAAHSQFEKIDTKSLRVFSVDIFKYIGHTALISLYLKAEDANLIPKRTNLILGNSNLYANSVLIEILKKECKMDLYSTEEIKSFDMLSTISEDIFTVEDIEEKEIPIQELGSKLDRISQEPRSSKIYLSRGQIADAERILHHLGYEKERWLCGLHIRRHGTEGGYDIFNNGLRNASHPHSYVDAIKLIAQEGGQVIRIGVNKAHSLRHLNLPNYIEICSEEYTDGLLDTYVLSNSDFFVGSQSGPGTCARMFARPTLFTNWSCVKDICFLGNSGSYLLLKNYVWTKYQLPLSLEQRFEDPCGESWSSNVLKLNGISVSDNTSIQLECAVKQLIDEIILSKPPSSHSLQSVFDDLLVTHRLSPIKLILSSSA